MSLLEIENLVLETYHHCQLKKTLKQPLLKNINLKIRKNQITSLIGESGAGKTILASTLAALLPESIELTTANFYYEGQLIDYNQVKKMRGKEIFYTPQNAVASLNPILKIRDQIREVVHISDLELLRIFSDLSIEKPEFMIHSYPFELSDGENQRCLLALAIALKPRLLILDEPTTALDVYAGKEFIRLVKKIKIDYGITILLISHNLSLIRDLSDYIYIILDGKIVEEGEIEKIFSDPSHFYTKELIDFSEKIFIC